ncbi:hypothetical protein FHU30_004754 [Actinomadura rupiterrae]|nr:hypothetical protein [Actinomadura rupiterrae]
MLRTVGGVTRTYALTSRRDVDFCRVAAALCRH